MRKTLILLLVIVLFAVLHEGLHALAASFYGEYEAFHVRPFGLEVTFQTPVAERQGAKWAVISGLPNLATVLVGLLLYSRRGWFAARVSQGTGAVGYWATLLFLWLDPLNLAVGPFLYGGDGVGVAVGLGVPVIIVQIAALLVFLFTRELVSQGLFPRFGIRSESPLFKPLVRLPRAFL